ncbi:MAG TPA: hypothetical protein VFT43_03265 [Candidatus Polarisedimenticolia bacterium]|nr:hypothetical protein [Candidatus Polarisedimenticolia bacterium]
MRLNKHLVSTAAAFVLAVLPALAANATSGKPAVTGQDNAVRRIEAATARQTEILTGLLSKVPAQAQSAIEKAIAAGLEGRDKAIAAITGHDVSGDDDSKDLTSAAAETPDASGKPEVTGLERARAAVAAGFEKSKTTLQGLLDQVPSQAVSRIEAALARLDGTRTVALQNLDSLIAGQKPDHPAPQDRADRPEPPSRPDRPERPERPQAPERPERPQVPDHPAPAHG